MIKISVLNFMFLLILYEIGLFFGSMLGKYWPLSFMITAVLSTLVLLIMELLFGGKE